MPTTVGDGAFWYLSCQPDAAGMAAVTARILRESGAKTLRWIPHGSAITMDYSEQRVNVKLDPQSRIEAVTCG